jgi:SNF2 family DNA or RNA helicase
MKECERIEKQWNLGKINILAAYPGSAALGLNLQHGGNNIVWFSLIDNFEEYDQFIERVERQGAMFEKVYNHVIIARNTVDEIIYAGLEKKDSHQETFLERVQAYRNRRIRFT